MSLQVTFDAKQDQDLPDYARQIIALLKDIDYGSLEIIVHDRRIVQIDKHQKYRLKPVTPE
ncbi:MAG: YezD family protein [Methylococcales bacterium]|nr:YezD family protein [Methylococcales bacterium]